MDKAIYIFDKQFVTATAMVYRPGAMIPWDGNPSSVYTQSWATRAAKPGQCSGCGAPGLVSIPCEWCGGKDVEERK